MGGVDLHDLPKLQSFNIDWCLGSSHLVSDPELQVRVVAARKDLALSGQEQRVLLAGADLADFKAVKCRYFVRRACLLTLLGVESALTEVVRTAADDIHIACQEKRVRGTTTDVNNILIQHVKSVDSRWDAGARNFLVAKLAKVVAAPRVDMGRLDTLVTTAGCNSLLLSVHRDCDREILAACQLLDFVVLQQLDQTWRSGPVHACWELSQVGAALDSELAEVVSSHHVQMSLVRNNAGVSLPAGDLSDHDIEAA